MNNKTEKLAFIALGIILDRMILSNRWLYLTFGFIVGMLINKFLWNYLLSLVGI